MSKKYIIIWDAGWGQGAEVVEAESLEGAQDMAYEACREEAENNWDYTAAPWSQELEDEYVR